MCLISHEIKKKSNNTKQPFSYSSHLLWIPFSFNQSLKYSWNSGLNPLLIYYILKKNTFPFAGFQIHKFHLIRSKEWKIFPHTYRDVYTLLAFYRTGFHIQSVSLFLYTWKINAFLRQISDRCFQPLQFQILSSLRTFKFVSIQISNIIQISTT